MIKEKIIIEKNRKLCEEYPFFIPHNRWTGKVPEDYDYSYTELDVCETPKGWDKIVMDMFRELKPILEKGNYLDKFHIVQCKEKYGTLRLYTNGLPKDIFDDVYKVIYKYEEISSHTCAFCGKEGKMTYRGYIIPCCKECWGTNYNVNGSYEDALEEPSWE